MAEVLMRVGRGGAGNYVSKTAKDINQDLETRRRASETNFSLLGPGGPERRGSASSLYVRTGRGGAGNFANTDTPAAAAPGASTPGTTTPEGSERRSSVSSLYIRTGRGGAGNLANSMDGSESGSVGAYSPSDMERRSSVSSLYFRTGRGGAGNLTTVADAPAAEAREAAASNDMERRTSVSSLFIRTGRGGAGNLATVADASEAGAEDSSATATAVAAQRSMSIAGFSNPWLQQAGQPPAASTASSGAAVNQVGAGSSGHKSGGAGDARKPSIAAQMAARIGAHQDRKASQSPSAPGRGGAGNYAVTAAEEERRKKEEEQKARAEREKVRNEVEGQVDGVLRPPDRAVLHEKRVEV